MQVLLQLFVQWEEIFYPYFENQLHVEQSWRGSPSQEIPNDLWNEKINYRRNLIHIPCIKNIVHIIVWIAWASLSSFSVIGELDLISSLINAVYAHPTPHWLPGSL